MPPKKTKKKTKSPAVSKKKKKIGKSKTPGKPKSKKLFEKKKLKENEKRDKAKDVAEAKQNAIIEEGQKSIRLDQLKDSAELFMTYDRIYASYLHHLKRLREWEAYTACWNTPNVAVLRDVNEYMAYWTEKLTIGGLLELIQHTPELIMMLYEMKNMLEIPFEDIDMEALNDIGILYQEFKCKQAEFIDSATLKMITDMSEEYDPEVGVFEKAEETRQISHCLWGNVFACPDHNGHSYKTHGFTFKVPESLMRTPGIYRLVKTDYDHYSDFNYSYFPPGIINPLRKCIDNWLISKNRTVEILPEFSNGSSDEDDHHKGKKKKSKKKKKKKKKGKKGKKSKKGKKGKSGGDSSESESEMSGEDVGKTKKKKGKKGTKSKSKNLETDDDSYDDDDEGEGRESGKRKKKKKDKLKKKSRVGFESEFDGEYQPEGYGNEVEKKGETESGAELKKKSKKKKKKSKNKKKSKKGSKDKKGKGGASSGTATSDTDDSSKGKSKSKPSASSNGQDEDSDFQTADDDSEYGVESKGRSKEKKGKKGKGSKSDNSSRSKDKKGKKEKSGSGKSGKSSSRSRSRSSKGGKSKIRSSSRGKKKKGKKGEKGEKSKGKGKKGGDDSHKEKSIEKREKAEFIAPTRSNELNLRNFIVLGGIYNFRVLKIPHQPRDRGDWSIHSVETDQGLKDEPFDGHFATLLPPDINDIWSGKYFKKDEEVWGEIEEEDDEENLAGLLPSIPAVDLHLPEIPMIMSQASQEAEKEKVKQLYAEALIKFEEMRQNRLKDLIYIEIQ